MSWPGNSISKLASRCRLEGRARAFLCRVASPMPGRTPEPKRGGRSSCTYLAEAGKVFEEVRRLQRPGLARTDPDVAEIFRRHGWEIIGPSPFLRGEA